MKSSTQIFDNVDRAITNWMARLSIPYLRVSLALIFVWFGALKFFPGMSPTIDLIERTTDIISLGSIPASVAIYALASTECLIGFGLLFNVLMRTTLLLLFLQMLATSTPIVLLPEVVFARPPFALTMEGHHIIKNLVLIGAGLVLGANVRSNKSRQLN